jgi:hypothetical protein
MCPYVEAFSVNQLSIRVEHYQYMFDIMELKSNILFFTSKVDDTAF